MTRRTKTWTTTWSESGIESWTRTGAMSCALALAVLLTAAEVAGVAQAPAADNLKVGISRVRTPVNTYSEKLGSLSGKLTDLYAKPLQGAIVVLRNTATGAESRTITLKNGIYRFTDLPAGDYTIEADSKSAGHGSLEGIFVPPGTEARVQTAMDFAPSAPQTAKVGLTGNAASPAIASSTPTNEPLTKAIAFPAQIAVVAANARANTVAASPVVTSASAGNPAVPANSVSDSNPVIPSNLASPSSPASTSNPAGASSSVSLSKTTSPSNAPNPSNPDRLDPVSLPNPVSVPTLPSLANLVALRSSIGPPTETALLEASFPIQPLHGFALTSRPSTGLIRQAPPLENAMVLPNLPSKTPLPLKVTGTPTASPLPGASIAVLTPEGLPAPNLRAIALSNPLKMDGALDVVNGIALSHAAVQIALNEARLRSLMASRQRIDPVTPVVATTLTAEQIQALPLVGRKWQNFVLDTPTASVQGAGSGRSANGANPPETTIDGVSTRLAFGSVSGSDQVPGKGSADGSPTAGMAMPWASGHGLQLAESAIRQVEAAAGNTEAEAAHAAGGQVSVTTQKGGPGFHGQGFLSDRENVWGARNPFTTWVQEIALATPGTVPVFTAEPYTPPDHETVWGVGVGSEWKKRRLFWFGAVDRYLRNDPGLATVKHPDQFFAQPANNQMQVLSARLGLPAANPVAEGLAAYSRTLEALGGLLGPAPRTASQWVGFGRLDWQAAEHHRFTFEGIGARWDSPGGGFTRVSEPFGNHSFGTGVASEEFLMARWEAFFTSNLLAVTQASVGRNILATHAQTPSAFEQPLLGPSIWGQLPQMVVDSRYGFTIGNPSRFGRGSFPDEKLYDLKQSLEWVRGSLLVKAGFEFAHNADATELLRNQTGTYHYSSVENFVSDALVFQKFGVAGELNPRDQHNCDQTGRVWVDSAGQLRGLGYLPCYSYYSQEIGPPGWQVSTNDWAGFATAQWKPAKRVVVSAGLRWEREQLPGPISSVNNPELPLTQKVPSLGNNWGPRVSMAMGSGESHWPVLRLGYGMYFSRTPNQVIETVLSQTGSFNGDLSFFLRPTDNLNQGGAPPFPYALSGAPGSVVRPGAVEFAPQFHNPEIHQAVAAVEERLPWHIQVTASAMLSLGRRLPSTADVNLDSPTPTQTITYAVVDATGAGPIKTPQITVPFYASWPSIISPTGFGGRLDPDYQQISEIMSRANSTYEAGMLRVDRYGRRGLTFRARYTYGHAMDWNPDESSQVAGSSVLDPADFKQEYGTSNLDVRHSAGIMAIYTAPWKLHGTLGKLANGWMVSGTGDFRSGLPYTMRTTGSLAEEFVAATGSPIVALGPGMNGSGGDNRVYGVGRNTYRYPATWKADMRVGKRIDLSHLRQLELLVESFNLFNHQNVTEIETTGYTISPGNLSGGLPTLNFLTGLKANTTAFGQPLNVNATDFYRERQIQVGLRVRF